MRYGYARISSTSSSERVRLDLAAQVETLREAGAQEIFSEQFTGMLSSRPELDKLMGVLSCGDTLMVTRLDRMARSARDGMDLVAGLLDRGVGVHVLNMGLMDGSPTGKLVTTIFFAFAEFERDMIVGRLSEGRQRAKERGVRVEGREPLELDGFDALYVRQQAGKITVARAIEELGCSRATWYNRAKTYAVC